MEVFDLEHWWMYFVQGLLALLVAFTVLAWPAKSVLVLTIAAGLYFLASGTVALIGSIMNRHAIEKAGLVALQGIVSLVIGGIILAWPVSSLAIVVFWIALWLIASGIVSLIRSIQMRATLDHIWLQLGLGLLQIAVGIAALGNPLASVQLVTFIFGFTLILLGILSCGLGLQLRSLLHLAQKEAAVLPVS